MAVQSLIHYTAVCHNCPAHVDARNAQAWAHQHANRNPGHKVELQLGYTVKCEGIG